MKNDLLNNSGKIVDSISVDDGIFKVLNTSVVRQAVLSELTNLRQGTHSSKNRSLVKGGGKKPKQKGRALGLEQYAHPCGKAVVLSCPEPHSYSHKLPRNEYIS